MNFFKQLSHQLSHILRRSGSRAHLLENNGSTQADYDQDVGEHRGRVPLLELVRDHPAAASCSAVDGCLSKTPESVLEEQTRVCVDHLIQRSEPMHLPEPPADLDQDLQQHLSHLQEAVCNELIRLAHALEARGLMGQQVNFNHCQIFNHLDCLLLKVSSFKNCFILMNWGLKTYLSQEMLGHPDLREMDPIKHVDILLLSEWGVKAKNKLLEKAQEEMRVQLENILQHHRQQDVCDGNTDEAFVQTYVDAIGCIAAMPRNAQRISSKLSYEVKEVGFQELYIFVERYREEQTKVLKKMEKTDKLEMIQFFKTLKTCQELKKHIQTEGEEISSSLCKEILEMLKKIEDLTLELLRGVVTKVAKKHLQRYFQSDKQQFVLLIDSVSRMFPRLENCDQTVTLEVCKILVHSYIKYLLKTKVKKLQRCWNPDVGEAVSKDAGWLHAIMSDLAPGVQEWSNKMKKIEEVLDCSDINALKLIVAAMQKDSLIASEDLHRLLRWKGLSKRDVREVLDAICDDYNPGASSRAWCSCLGS
ncbi:exocyst complex component 3-like protein [Betta splendens]|uniref:Exocyst complex component 3-like protein n=1 Tax=Betta splendens TaxID=158456 RepID=A0A9W2XIS3_BETSP|nr:exocyst complex component 3-like protein [Betta splendens]